MQVSLLASGVRLFRCLSTKEDRMPIGLSFFRESFILTGNTCSHSFCSQSCLLWGFIFVFGRCTNEADITCVRRSSIIDINCYIPYVKSTSLFVTKSLIIPQRLALIRRLKYLFWLQLLHFFRNEIKGCLPWVFTIKKVTNVARRTAFVSSNVVRIVDSRVVSLLICTLHA